MLQYIDEKRDEGRKRMNYMSFVKVTTKERSGLQNISYHLMKLLLLDSKKIRCELDHLSFTFACFNILTLAAFCNIFSKSERRMDAKIEKERRKNRMRGTGEGKVN